ncbi:hypothetical protein D3C85_1786360 [compost metagenome]
MSRTSEGVIDVPLENNTVAGVSPMHGVSPVALHQSKQYSDTLGPPVQGVLEVPDPGARIHQRERAIFAVLLYYRLRRKKLHC